jgi:hypothetical protein
MAIYLAEHVRQHLQEELERHLVTGLNGRCTACGDPEPCRRRGEWDHRPASYRLRHLVLVGP